MYESSRKPSVLTLERIMSDPRFNLNSRTPSYTKHKSQSDLKLLKDVLNGWSLAFGAGFAVFFFASGSIEYRLGLAVAFAVLVALVEVILTTMHN